MTILDVRFNNSTSKDAVNHIFDELSRGTKSEVLFLNANSLFIAQSDLQYRKILNSSRFVLLDGIGIRIIARLFGVRMIEDCNGTDLAPFLLQSAASKGYKVFFLGCTENVAHFAAEAVSAQFPGINIVGSHHGFFDNDEEVIVKINSSAADILFVSLGSPKQEKWIAEHRSALNPKLCLGVGALLQYLSGNVRRAPPGWRKLHLEWLWRVIHNPKAFARRYFINVPTVFFIAVYKRLVG